MPFIKGHPYGQRIEKGQHLSKVTEFKKGMIPHNKGIKFREKRNCLICNKEFSDYPSQFKARPNWYKYCSIECSAKARSKKVKRECLRCDNSFEVKLSVIKRGHGIFCSYKCKKESQKGQLAWNKGKHLPQITGKNHWNWQGGITPINIKLRNSLEYEEWRKACMERDLYTCQDCEEIGGELQVDHIKPFALHPELRFDLNNGRTLCKNCHLKTNTWGGRIYAL